MAVTINDTRTEWDDADAVTDWTVPDGGVNTTDYAEASAAITSAIDTTSDSVYATKSAVDLTATLVYVWSANIAEQNVWKPGTLADAPHCLYISDGTNDLALLQAGNDREVFKHAETQVVFQCFVIDTDYIDTKDTAGEIYEINGSVASFDVTNVTEIGAYYTTNSKSFKGWNAGCDIIRYGNDGLQVYGGTTGDRGTFEEIVLEDRSKTSGKMYGIIREYAPGAYGVQGTLSFGRGATSGTDSWFEDSGVTIIYEDRDVDDHKFEFIVDGHFSDSNNFYLSNSAITAAGPGLHVGCENTHINNLSFDTVVFNGITDGVEFPTDSASYNHEVINCTFNGCSYVEPGTVDFRNNIITNPTGAYGAVLGSYGSDTWSGNTWISPGTGYAIFIFQAGTYDFTDLTFIGFADQGGTATNRSIWNISAGETIINNYGSTGISVNHTGGGTTVVNNPVTTAVNVATVAGVPIENARVFLQASDGTGPLPYEDTVTITSASTTASVSHTAHGLINGQHVVLRGANQEEYNGVYAISNSSTNAYDYTFAGSGTSPATGTIKATGVLVYGLSSAGGAVSDSRSLGAADQPVTGHARKSSGTPFYKSSAIVGTVDAEDGATFTAVMISDE